MRAAFFAACLLLPGCSVFKPAQIVEVPVAVSCVAEVPAAPSLVTDAELKAMSDYQFTLALWRDRLLRAGYIGELEAVVEGCKVTR